LFGSNFSSLLGVELKEGLEELYPPLPGPPQMPDPEIKG